MSKSTKPARRTAEMTSKAAFGEVVQLIRAARQRVARTVNAEVIDLYWRIGEYLHRRIEADGWAK